MKKGLIFAILLAGIFACHKLLLQTKTTYSIFKTEKVKNFLRNDTNAAKKNNSVENGIRSDKSHEESCSLTVPESIKKDIPEEMQYMVLLQLVLNLIKSEYVLDLAEGEITEKTISGLLTSLDIHSGYLNKKAFDSFKNHIDGEFGGIGVEMMVDEGLIRIISPIDDTPAYKAGIKSGDLIICINDEFINGISSYEALEKLRGKPKTKVKLKIKRENKEPFDIEIERNIIKVQSVKAEILDDIGYIRISTFGKNTAAGVKKFINDIKNKKVHGIVLDLRNNSGGILEEGVEVANIFLDDAKSIVSLRGRTEENAKVFTSTGKDLTNGQPLVLLINSGTASAPEILAGALRDNKRAIIVGTRSFGKGSVQKIFPLSEDSAIKLTIARYYTPNGESIQANGINPDIEAEPGFIKKFEKTFIIREEFFNNALDADKKVKNKQSSDKLNKKMLDEIGKKKDKTEEEDNELLYREMSLQDRIKIDYQLTKAFDVIKTIHKFQLSNKETQASLEKDLHNGEKNETK